MNKNIKMKNKRKINNTLVYTISVLIIVVITLIAGIFPKAFGMYAQGVYDRITKLVWLAIPYHCLCFRCIFNILSFF